MSPSGYDKSAGAQSVWSVRRYLRGLFQAHANAALLHCMPYCFKHSHTEAIGAGVSAQALLQKRVHSAHMALGIPFGHSLSRPETVE